MGFVGRELLGCLFTDGALGPSSEKKLASQEILRYPDSQEKGLLSERGVFREQKSWKGSPTTDSGQTELRVRHNLGYREFKKKCNSPPFFS
jgi:hypothetical protein